MLNFQRHHQDRKISVSLFEIYGLKNLVFPLPSSTRGLHIAKLQVCLDLLISELIEE